MFGFVMIICMEIYWFKMKVNYWEYKNVFFLFYNKIYLGKILFWNFFIKVRFRVNDNRLW